MGISPHGGTFALVPWPETVAHAAGFSVWDDSISQSDGLSEVQVDFPCLPECNSARCFEREGLTVAYTMEDFRRDFAKEHLREFFTDLTLEERRELLTDLTLGELLKGLTPGEQRELLKSLSPDQLDEIERYLERRKHEITSPKQKKKEKKS